MAFIAVTSLMRTIELEFLQPNPRLALQNKELIVSVHKRLGQLLDFLDESEKKANNSEEMRNLMPRIRQVALNFLTEVTLKVEDDIEAALLVDSVHKTLDETLQHVLQYIEEVKEIIKVADNLVKNNLQIREDGPSSSVSSVLQENISNAGSSQHSSKLDGAMVGHSEELKDVMAKIFQSSLKQRQVMAIVGMGGIGKTTFARTIYDVPRVSSHFNLRGWTTVSQGYSVVRVLLELCRSIISMPYHIDTEGVDLHGWTTVPKEQSAMYVLHELCDSIMSNLDDTNVKGVGELKQQLHKILLGQRYLIIVDDIWSKNAWDDIQCCFPDENNGSRILLTTREKEIAEYANSGEYSFDMRLLNPEESWTLFYQKLQDKERLNFNFKTVGKNIVEKCHGLPLAIVLLAGLLSTGNKSLDDWKNLETTINSLVALDLGEQFYSRIFTLSYTSLPQYLKGCFLYFGLFPEDSEIPIKKIIRLWIAEGLVTPVSEKRIEEVGEDYLHDLIKRSLVMVSGKSFDGKIKTCRIHDLLHPHAFPRNLKKLTFVKTFMPWKAMTIVSMLPNLETLKLKRYACVGQENGFPRLKFLLISITDLRDWKADVIDNPFPVLERLLLRNCFELKEMPSWIEDICSLQLMHLDHCRHSLVNSARQIQKEKQSLGATLIIQEFNTQSDDLFGNEEDEKKKREVEEGSELDLKCRQRG